MRNIRCRRWLGDLAGLGIAGLPALGIAACASPLGDPTVTFDPTMVTRAFVHLESDTPVTAHVEYGDKDADSETWVTTPFVTGTSLDFVLYLHADTTSEFRIKGEDERGRPVNTPKQEISTERLPSDIPDFSPLIGVTLDGLSPWLLTSLLGGELTASAVMIVTLDGRVVWYWQPEDTVIPSARFDAASGLIYGTGFDIADDGHAYTFTLPLAGGDVEKHALQWAHHDAIMLDDRETETSPGTIVVPVSTFADIDGVTVAGDSIVEISPDGTETTIWNAFDHLVPAENASWHLTQFPQGQKDWTHGNGLDYDDTDGAYYFSLWGPEQIVKIDRATGNTVWHMGGPENEFDFGDDPGFGPQHAPEFSDGELRLFDNGNSASGSRGVSYAVDEGARTATLTWSFEPADTQWALVLGDVALRPDGSHLLAWGSSGDIFMTDPANDLAGFIRCDKPLAIGQVTELPQLP